MFRVRDCFIAAGTSGEEIRMGEDRQNYLASDLRKAASLQAEKRDWSTGTNYGTIFGTNGIK